MWLIEGFAVRENLATRSNERPFPLALPCGGEHRVAAHREVSRQLPALLQPFVATVARTARCSFVDCVCPSRRLLIFWTSSPARVRRRSPAVVNPGYSDAQEYTPENAEPFRTAGLGAHPICLLFQCGSRLRSASTRRGNRSPEFNPSAISIARDEIANPVSYKILIHVIARDRQLRKAPDRDWPG